ncbi:MAG: DUF4437 domain-containing protein [Saprospiraceae bacterium]
MMKELLFTILAVIIIISCAEKKENTSNTADPVISAPTNQVVLSSEIQWEKLNPARGDQSPQAGTVWGDRKGKVPTGFLAKFVDGFSSPPHIHNVTYRAMVIKGLIHNDDQNAEKMWMPAGSFWTQPAGATHITAAKGAENIAYVEIDNGPYLVKPIEEAFDNGERPINIDKTNLVWLTAAKTKIIDQAKSNVAVAFLWENNAMTGNLVKLPTDFDGEIISDGAQFHAILIAGEAEYFVPQSKETKSLDPGSYFTSTGKAKHEIKISKGLETIIYIRTNGELKIR